MGNTREFLAVCELEAMALVRWFTVLENGDVPQQPVKLPEGILFNFACEQHGTFKDRACAKVNCKSLYALADGFKCVLLFNQFGVTTPLRTKMLELSAVGQDHLKTSGCNLRYGFFTVKISFALK